jgi:hypothetical protein
MSTEMYPRIPWELVADPLGSYSSYENSGVVDLSLGWRLRLCFVFLVSLSS